MLPSQVLVPKDKVSEPTRGLLERRALQVGAMGVSGQRCPALSERGAPVPPIRVTTSPGSGSDVAGEQPLRPSGTLVTGGGSMGQGLIHRPVL